MIQLKSSWELWVLWIFVVFWADGCNQMVLRFFARVQLYFHTLRYLKMAQVVYRILFRLQQIKPDLRPSPKVSSLPWTGKCQQQEDRLCCRQLGFVFSTKHMIFQPLRARSPLNCRNFGSTTFIILIVSMRKAQKLEKNGIVILSVNGLQKTLLALE